MSIPGLDPIGAFHGDATSYGRSAFDMGPSLPPPLPPAPFPPPLASPPPWEPPEPAPSSAADRVRRTRRGPRPPASRLAMRTGRREALESDRSTTPARRTARVTSSATQPRPRRSFLHAIFPDSFGRPRSSRRSVHEPRTTLTDRRAGA